jgi:uncharacterized phage protein gp47/JayE
MGLTATGVTVKDVDEVISDIEADELANVDSSLQITADSVIGQLNGIFAAAVAELWDFFQEIYWSAYPDTATGQSLSYGAALTGAIRRPATKAELEVVFDNDAPITIPAGTRIYVDGDPDSEFELTADLVTSTGLDVATVYATTPGKRTTIAEDDGLVIATPLAGLNAVYSNAPFLSAFTEGADEETDSALRYRREQSLALAGSSTVDAIRSAMLTVTGVDSCTVFANPTSVVDSNGVPPYAIEVLVYSSVAPNYDPDELAAEIWANKPAGTQTYGSEGPVAVTDAVGNQHDIYYSEPVSVRLYVLVTLQETTDGAYESVGDAGVKDAIADWALRTLRVGQSVYASDIINVVADIPGVRFVYTTSTFVEAGDPTPDQVAWIATPRQLGTIAAADVTVISI